MSSMSVLLCGARTWSHETGVQPHKQHGLVRSTDMVADESPAARRDGRPKFVWSTDMDDMVAYIHTELTRSPSRVSLPLFREGPKTLNPKQKVPRSCLPLFRKT